MPLREVEPPALVRRDPQGHPAQLTPWPAVRSTFDEVWFVDTPAELRRRWLVARHVRFGMTPGAAEAWAAGPDEANARLVRATRARADVVVDAGRLWPDA